MSRKCLMAELYSIKKKKRKKRSNRPFKHCLAQEYSVLGGSPINNGQQRKLRTDSVSYFAHTPSLKPGPALPAVHPARCERDQVLQPPTRSPPRLQRRRGGQRHAPHCGGARSPGTCPDPIEPDLSGRRPTLCPRSTPAGLNPASGTLTGPNCPGISTPTCTLGGHCGG